MLTAEIARLSDAERLEHVREQVARLEEETARAVLAHENLPTDDLSVRRHVFARHLLMTLRLKEHSV